MMLALETNPNALTALRESASSARRVFLMYPIATFWASVTPNVLTITCPKRRLSTCARSLQNMPKTIPRWRVTLNLTICSGQRKKLRRRCARLMLLDANIISKETSRELSGYSSNICCAIQTVQVMNAVLLRVQCPLTLSFFLQLRAIQLTSTIRATKVTLGGL
ncbi:hypothetical protein PsorP6_015986 [Peronosclerospora sorghi]|uniref:Uncharacterized protein n=1 Tax=Peronosclerospora sorghi TaxID=230839 RepID=A0ACC0WN02_9STRA|nr:hypothetical protein PsorP6_015986 [Peronosclerospora sorghi]